MHHPGLRLGPHEGIINNRGRTNCLDCGAYFDYLKTNEESIMPQFGYMNFVRMCPYCDRITTTNMRLDAFANAF